MTVERRRIAFLTIVAVLIALTAFMHYRAARRNLLFTARQARLRVLARAAWPVFRGGQGLPGTATGPFSTNLHLLWTFKAGEEIKSSPVIGGGCVYIGASESNLYCLSLEDGRQRWVYNTAEAVEAPPLLAGGMVVAGSLDGCVYALDAGTGALKWKYQTGDKVIGSANWAHGADGTGIVILAGSYDSSMHCIDASSGTSLWTHETGNYINGAPAVEDGIVAFGGCDAQLRFVSVTGGIEQARVDAGAYIAASPVLAGGEAFACTYAGKLLCVDVAARRVTWEYASENGAAFFSSPAVDGERVVAGARDARVHCVNRKDGTRRWVFHTQGDVDSSPVLCGPYVVVGSNDGRVYVLDADTGLCAWQYEIGAAVSSSPAVTGGMIIVGADDGRVYAFGPLPR
ncbi:PQQ-binding-like beta-propeller repeat protein [bacterium]|nr:PQQ-binding-like beta-propeller repeat protein [bacterium]